MKELAKFTTCSFSVSFALIGCSESTQESKRIDTPTLEYQPVKKIQAVNVAARKRVIARAGEITYPSWGNANDDVDYNTTTNYPEMS